MIVYYKYNNVLYVQKLFLKKINIALILIIKNYFLYNKKE